MNLLKRLVLSFILLAVCCGSSLAQLRSLKFGHITSEDGLPQSTIHGIVKDKYGFMWFGTWGGLCRYDGYSFKTYMYDPNDPKSINNNRIHSIVKDKDQNIWIRTFDNDIICRYNYAHDNFDRIAKQKLPVKFAQLLNRRFHLQTVNFRYKNFVWNIDPQVNLLVETDSKTGRKQTYTANAEDPGALNDSYVTDIYKDNQNIFWVGTFSNGINKANLNAKPFEHFYHNPLKTQSIIDNNVRAICEDKSGNLWIGTREKGISVIKDGKYHHIRKNADNTINDDQIRSIYCDSRGIVWIGTKEGLNSYDPRKNSFRQYKQSALQKNAVFGIIEDESNNLLLATWDGVFQYDVVSDKLLRIDSVAAAKEYFGRVIIRDRRGLIWVGTEGSNGIRVLKYVRKQRKYVVERKFHHSANPNSLSDNRIYCIYEDKDGRIWIGNGNGLDCYDPATNKITRLSEIKKFTRSPVAAIAEDSKGYLWISHKKGITHLNRKTLAVRNFTLQDGLQSNEFSEAAVYESKLDKRLYFGGNNGFNVFNPDSIFAEKTLPQTHLTELQILNRRVDINDTINGRIILTKPLYLSHEIELTYDDKSVAIEFAGLHYSNPKGNRYAYKLDGFDKDWVFTDASRRIATYSNLEPGRYVFNVISSNSDGVWNFKPATLVIAVLPPFWASRPAYVLYALIFMMIFYGYHYYSGKFTRLRSKLAYESLIREKENELHQSKLLFFTNLSHEIKTPLTLILAPLEKLGEYFAENQFVHSQLDTMKINGERLLKLINQLLDFRKLETGNMKIDLKKKDIISFLHANLLAFEPLTEARNIDLRFEGRIKPYYFSFDEDKLEKVLNNLLSNAIKFTANNLWIKVRFTEAERSSEGLAVIEVINPGKGIQEEDRDRIFEPFKQGSGTNQGGTGLGLAFSKGLVELHGGTIDFKNVLQPDGSFETNFFVQLPLNISEEPETVKVAQADNISGNDEINTLLSGSGPEPKSLQPVQEHPLKKERVLINGRSPLILLVEDNADLRAYLKVHFEQYYKVAEAENGKEGLALAVEEIPDLVISDVMMDEMDGFEFCRSVKANANTGHIPVILLTAKDPVEDRITGIETGADDYITKPFNLDFLTSRVKNLLISRNNLKEKYRKEISIQPTADTTLSPDDKFLRKLLEYIETRISSPELNVEDICHEIGVSRAKLYRKVKDLTGLTIAEVIKEIRFKRAKQLLREQKFKINEIAFMVGFSEANYFGKCFRVEFGISPSEYVQNYNEGKLE